jgi:hypothetical protein
MKIAYAYALAFGLLLPSIAEAQTVPLYVQQACISDTQRFCSSVIFDAAKREVCMKQNWNGLSEGCKVALVKWLGGGSSEMLEQ